MIEKIREILAEQLDIEIEDIKADSHIQEELEADSLDVMDIMTEIEDEIFEVTIPLPANEYFYAFNIEYSDGSSETNVKDPANPALANDGSDAGWSLFYVGNGETKGQEYINPRTDGKTGTYSFVNYLAEDGTTQPLGIYLPNGYDAIKHIKQSMFLTVAGVTR